MTAVRFVRGAGGYHVTFRYDPRLVDLMKTVPAGARSWNKATKTWWVDDPHGQWLAADMSRMGYTVGSMHERRGQHTDRAGRGDNNNSAWAAALFERVGPERAPAVQRALTKVLHPDVGGDTALMQELNDARPLT